MFTKNILSFLIIGILCLSCEKEKTINREGRVAYINLEGGFYGIYGDDGVGYDPINLPDDFQKDSLRVVFEGTILTEHASTHMWGTLIELNQIERIR